MGLRQYGEGIAIGALKLTAESARLGWWASKAIGGIAIQPVMAGARYVAELTGDTSHLSERLAREVPVYWAEDVVAQMRDVGFDSDPQRASILAATGVRAVNEALETPGIPPEVVNRLAREVAEELDAWPDLAVPLPSDVIDGLRDIAARGESAQPDVIGDTL